MEGVRDLFLDLEGSEENGAGLEETYNQKEEKEAEIKN